MLHEAEARVDAGDDVGRGPGNLLRLLAGGAHLLRRDVRLAQAVGRSLQLDAIQDVDGHRRVDIEKLGHVITRQLHDVLLHREGDDGAVRRPCQRITVPHERFVFDGDVVRAVAFLEVLDEALGEDAVASARLLVEDVVDVGDEHEVAVHVGVLHVPRAWHREGLGHAGLDESLVAVLLPLVAGGGFAPDRRAPAVAELVALVVVHRLVGLHEADGSEALGLRVRVLEVRRCDVVRNAAQLRVLCHALTQAFRLRLLVQLGVRGHELV